MRGEIEFLQGAFESYKSQLHVEMNDKWKKREHDERIKHEEETQKLLHDLKSRLLSERAHEKAEAAREHHKELQGLRREHKKDMDGLVRKFSNAAADMEKLKQTRAELEEATRDLQDIQERYDRVCDQFSETTRELADTKVRLMSFEQHFQDKVQEVDDKYRTQIHNLMTQNTELRRVYMRKCGELFDEKSLSEKAVEQRAMEAKDTMKTPPMIVKRIVPRSREQIERVLRREISRRIDTAKHKQTRSYYQEALIESRNRALVNLAATDLDFAERTKQPKDRPQSAPTSKRDKAAAHSTAGETLQFVQRAEERRPRTCKPRILEVIQREKEEGLHPARAKHREDMEKFVMESFDESVEDY